MRASSCSLSATRCARIGSSQFATWWGRCCFGLAWCSDRRSMAFPERFQSPVNDVQNPFFRSFPPPICVAHVHVGSCWCTVCLVTFMSDADMSVPNLGPQMVITNWALDAFCGVFLGLRLYCKLSRRRVLWWDDHFLIASWVSLSIPDTRWIIPPDFVISSRHLARIR